MAQLGSCGAEAFPRKSHSLLDKIPVFHLGRLRRSSLTPRLRSFPAGTRAGNNLVLIKRENKHEPQVRDGAGVVCGMSSSSRRLQRICRLPAAGVDGMSFHGMSFHGICGMEATIPAGFQLLLSLPRSCATFQTHSKGKIPGKAAAALGLTLTLGSAVSIP